MFLIAFAAHVVVYVYGVVCMTSIGTSFTSIYIEYTRLKGREPLTTNKIIKGSLLRFLRPKNP